MRTLGIDVGGTKIAVAVVEKGRILERSQAATPQSGCNDVLDLMAALARPLLSNYPEVKHIGVGVPGPTDVARARTTFIPNIADMRNVPVVAALQKRLPDISHIVLENDANAAGYAEHLYGAAEDLESSVYLTLSTGIGGGIFIAERMLRGANALAGEVGHISLNIGGPLDGDGHTGTWESFASGRAIARDARYAYADDSLSTADVFAKAQAGERKALQIIDNAARYTGIGIANVHKILNPNGFVLGGGLMKAGDFYLEQIRHYLDAYTVGYPPVTLRLVKLGQDAGVIGVAAVALS